MLSFYALIKFIKGAGEIKKMLFQRLHLYHVFNFVCSIKVTNNNLTNKNSSLVCRSCRRSLISGQENL